MLEFPRVRGIGKSRAFDQQFQEVGCSNNPHLDGPRPMELVSLTIHSNDARLFLAGDRVAQWMCYSQSIKYLQLLYSSPAYAML